jgi:hypothetical protein
MKEYLQWLSRVFNYSISIIKANASLTGKCQGLHKSVPHNAANTTQTEESQSRTVLYPIKTEAGKTAPQSGN